MKQQRTLATDARIGIINRGEAAMRFIRAVREYNSLHDRVLSTAAFYLDVEEEALFVKEADLAIRLSSLPDFAGSIGSPYLNRRLMVEALKHAGCSAVWVGWGFLSEDAEFIEMLEQEGLVFLGPPSRAMALLGDKIQAKDLAERSNVPILPWSKGAVNGLEEARVTAETIGYPCIIKAANAGGGRGIRFVMDPDELERQYNSAREETVRITGGDVVFMEHLVQRGRHLEVQCLSDHHGTVRTFGVRDCSVQRRNQKIIEETPPPQFSAEYIAMMEAAAARLIKAAGYESAGTVEFLYDLDTEAFYFMEVNTRLQVEHPITEQLYAVDLVKGQIDVACGASIAAPAAAEPRGHVVEVRLNAEDPDRDFTPAPGRVERYIIPSGPGIRVDSGIEHGSVIPTEFDSMVAKIIAPGPTRREAIARLKRALQELRIKIERGTTNRPFLLELLNTPEVVAGGVSTRFVEQWLVESRRPAAREHFQVALVAAAVDQYLTQYRAEIANFNQQLSTGGYPREVGDAKGIQCVLSAEGRSYQFLVQALGSDRYHLEINGLILVAQYTERDQESLLVYGDKRYRIQLVDRGDALQCEVNGVPYSIGVEAGGAVKAPSPSLVLSVAVEPGQTVEKGEILLSLEAMKMEMVVEAPEAGVVKEVLVRKGEQVAAGQPLVQVEAGGEVDNRLSQQAPPIEFTPEHPNADRAAWQMLAREYRAMFLGYDHRNDVFALFTAMKEHAENDETVSAQFVECLLDGIRMFAGIERLFAGTSAEAAGFARPATYQELLVHYFKRIVDREKGLPEEFLRALEQVLGWYGLHQGSDEDRLREALLRMYRSHADLKLKRDLLQFSLFELERRLSSEAVPEHLADTLDGVAFLSQSEAPNLADAAIHARYHFVDRVLLQQLREVKGGMVSRALDLVSGRRGEHKPHTKRQVLQNLVDTGHNVVAGLVSEIIADPSGTRASIAIEVLARRINRDREYHGGERVTLNSAAVTAFRAHCRTSPYEPGDQRFVTSLVAVTEEQHYEAAYTAIAELLSEQSAEHAVEAEVALLIARPAQNTDNESFLQYALQQPLPVAHLALAVVPPDGRRYYRTLHYSPEGAWCEDLGRLSFGPVSYRELRVFRLRRFDLVMLYRSESVYLIGATAKDNPRDERLFALVQIPSTRVELDEHGNIARMVALENVLMEAVYAMRAEQATRKRRLHWNRIFLHARTVMGADIDQLRDYGGRLAARTADLGLEQLVVYSRRPRPSDGELEQLELVFENVSGSSFSLRGRSPSTEPLAPMDAYVAKVVRARQRGTLYPYEIIKMATRTGYPVTETFPRGEFEEFDIAVDASTSSQEVVSVKSRPYGQNESNIVFGIITNYLPTHPDGIRRVIILSDPTGDMGSLAEAECRRVIAALDLAQERGFPVEWIPISAGARIDMQSGTENLDWTAATLRRIIQFTQAGGEINIIVSGINVGAQSYWNAEATMLMHTRGLLIMTEDASMLLTGKKALDFSGSVSAENNLAIGGVERIMGPNGQAQVRAKNLYEAFSTLFLHYQLSYSGAGSVFPRPLKTNDPPDRDVCKTPYQDNLGQGFSTVGDIFSAAHNPERKKPFEMRQVMAAVKDADHPYFERWQEMRDAETAIVWQARIGGYGVGLIGIESRSLSRIGEIPHDGPESWSGGTLFPQSSKKVARALNAFSRRLPVVLLANLSGFDGSPESLRKLQLEYGAEIGRAVVTFQGPIIFLVTARYHGGAYVVFSKALSNSLHSAALEGAYASVIGGAPAAAVVFPRQVLTETRADERVKRAQHRLKEDPSFGQVEYDELFQQVHQEKQSELAAQFDRVHSVERAKSVGSIDEIIPAAAIRPYLISRIEHGMDVR